MRVVIDLNYYGEYHIFSPAVFCEVSLAGRSWRWRTRPIPLSTFDRRFSEKIYGDGHPFQIFNDSPPSLSSVLLDLDIVLNINRSRLTFPLRYRDCLESLEPPAIRRQQLLLCNPKPKVLNLVHYSYSRALAEIYFSHLNSYFPTTTDGRHPIFCGITKAEIDYSPLGIHDFVTSFHSAILLSYLYSIYTQYNNNFARWNLYLFIYLSLETHPDFLKALQ